MKRGARWSRASGGRGEDLWQGEIGSGIDAKRSGSGSGRERKCSSESERSGLSAEIGNNGSLSGDGESQMGESQRMVTAAMGSAERMDSPKVRKYGWDRT